jgi:hypothetical protein
LALGGRGTVEAIFGAECGKDEKVGNLYISIETISTTIAANSAASRTSAVSTVCSTRITIRKPVTTTSTALRCEALQSYHPGQHHFIISMVYLWGSDYVVGTPIFSHLLVVSRRVVIDSIVQGIIVLLKLETI